MLTDERIENNYNLFITLLKDNVKREGINNLISWLNVKDTKIAPATSKYYGSYAGGLVEHVLNVYERLKRLVNLEYGDECPYSDETLALVGLLLDISKVGYYEISEKNVKDVNGNWTKVPFYQAKDTSSRLTFGSHSMNSYYMVSKFLKLTYEEELALLYHMGGFDASDDTISVKNISTAFEKSPLALLLHQADAQATFLDGKRINE
jgi:hypothetical protein